MMLLIGRGMGRGRGQGGYGDGRKGSCQRQEKGMGKCPYKGTSTVLGETCNRFPVVLSACMLNVSCLPPILSGKPDYWAHVG